MKKAPANDSLTRPIKNGLQASVWLTAEALRARTKSNEDIILKKPSANSVVVRKNPFFAKMSVASI